MTGGFANHSGYPESPAWRVLVPLKGGPHAKSRLRAALANKHDNPTAATALVTAMATDCTQALVRSPVVASVAVITADPMLAADMRQLGLSVLAERHPGAGLNTAISDATHELARTLTGRCQQEWHPTAVVLGDVATVTTDDITQTLTDIWLWWNHWQPEHPAHDDPAAARCLPPQVAIGDAAGTGTTALAAVHPLAVRPMFGPGSLRAHRNTGTMVLNDMQPVPVRLQHDIDDLPSLGLAQQLGMGPCATAVLRQYYGENMQATVQSFDVASESGTVVTDTGALLPFDAQAWQTSQLRMVRPGQRLTIDITGTGADTRVTHMRLGSIGIPPAGSTW